MGSQTSPGMNVVIVGHVDHGKSTVVGRLLADTGTVGESKIEQVRQACRRSGKPFEYAFLIDALKDEQAQGTTIDSARVFFRSRERRYVIIDAPGHIEFLKNMVSGAARAEAAILVIDAKEGVQENSRRHGYLTAMLGIGQLVVLVNKMDLVECRKDAFEAVTAQYRQFLGQVGLDAIAFVPVCARDGDWLTGPSQRMSWYTGLPLLALMDSLQQRADTADQPLRLPVQDIYKFAARGDDRRIVAGTVASGTLKVGDAVVFAPSMKQAQVATIESFNTPPRQQVPAGQATGVTLSQELYIRPGEIMYRQGDPAPWVGASFRANIFWLGRTPFMSGRPYKLKLGTERTPVYLKQVDKVLDASTLEVTQRGWVGRHEVAECVLETHRPLACDLADTMPETGRFVLVDGYDISGGGIITEQLATFEDSLKEHVQLRDATWVRSAITPLQRVARLHQKPKLVVVTGGPDPTVVAQRLESRLFLAGRGVYFLGLASLRSVLDADVAGDGSREEHFRRLGEVAHILTDAGQIVLTCVADLRRYDVDVLRILTAPNDFLLVTLDDEGPADMADLIIDSTTSTEDAVARCEELLREREVLLDYVL